MYIWIEIITTVSLIAIMHIFLQGIFEKRDLSIWWWPLAYFVYGVGVTILSLFPSQSIIRMLYNTISMVVLCLLLFKAKLLPAVFASCSMSAICVLTEVLMFAIYSVAGVNTTLLMSRDEMRILYVVTSQIIYLLIILVILAITRRKRSAVTGPFILMLSPGYIVSIVIGCQFCIMVEQGYDLYTWPFILAAVILVYFNILIVFYAERVKEAANIQRENELTEHHYALQERYYEQLRSEQNETRALFHDIKKYMLAMQALTSEVNSEQAERVMEDVQGLFDDIGSVVDVGNPVVNVILSKYVELAKMENIDIDYDISIPEELPISASDAYILIGNTIDNAIEACSHVNAEERYIRIKFRLVNDMLFYQIENPYIEIKPQQEKNKYHGYGLRSVKRCIEKYNGDMSIVKDKSIFTLSARMNL